MKLHLVREGEGAPVPRVECIMCGKPVRAVHSQLGKILTSHVCSGGNHGWLDQLAVTHPIALLCLSTVLAAIVFGLIIGRPRC